MKPNDRRSPEAALYRRWYNSSRWKHPRHGVRARQLAEYPLCQRCDARGEITPATEVHHNPPHRGDEERFWNGPFESLCKTCHDIDARHEEQHGYMAEVGSDGWPIDPRHPANSGILGPPDLDAPHPEWIKPSTIPLHIVCGAPGSGKSTYVQQHARPTDLVLDLDEIAAALSGQPIHDWDHKWIGPALSRRNELLRQLSQPCQWSAAWLIVSEPGAARRDWWRAKMRPARVIVVNPGRATCAKRIADRGARADRRQAVDQWFIRYTPSTLDIVVDTSAH